MPVRGDLDDAAGFEGAHGRHPGVGGFGEVGFCPGLAVVGGEVGLQVVVHERMVVEDPGFLELGD